MTLEQLKNLTCDNVEDKDSPGYSVGGSGSEETFRNVLLKELVIEVKQLTDAVIAIGAQLPDRG